MAFGPFNPEKSRYRKVRIAGRSRAIHVHRAEAALGKHLPKGAHVHHADLTRREDGQLVICQDHAYHQLLHIRTKVLRAGGDPNTQRICAHCKLLHCMDHFSKDTNRPSGLQRICIGCQKVLSRSAYLRKLERAKVAL